jgi:membrane protease YdiL (CAAX protease family)
LLSVFPQEILFRAFLFERYGPILHGDFAKAAASAIAFGFAHIVFGNWISVVLSAAGGALFAITYLKTGSLLAACLEHAIFGDFIFTIGLGQYFFHGARR